MADYWNHNKPALVSALRSIKQQATSMATTMATTTQEPIGPAHMIMYPTYSYQNKQNAISITVRGWLYYEGDLSRRRNKLLVATTERFVGGQSGGTEFQQELLDISNSRQLSSESVAAPQNSKILRQRMEPFFRKSVALEPVDVDIYGARGEFERFVIDTDAGGRFEHTFTLGFKPHTVRAEARDTQARIMPQFIGDHGVSVISDVDDTVRLTGILNGKRDTLRNVLVAGYEKVKLKGVAEWYQQMEARGASFHYVSNSPWQMFDCVEGFLESQHFPRGSMHLKRYQGLIDGIFEPVVHRKVKSLDRILSDFPQRKFILIGDGGELDLETYVLLAREYPDQILAIYIRDLITPANESLEVEVPALEQDLIDLEEPYVAPKSTKPGRPNARRFNSQQLLNGIKAVSPRKKKEAEPETAAPAAAGAAPALPPRDSAPLHGPTHVPSHTSHTHPTSGGVAGAVFGAASRPGAIHEVAHMAREQIRGKQMPPGFVTSSQDYSEYDRIDKERKRSDSWKARLIEAKRSLPKGVELKLWQQPDQVMSEALRKVHADHQLL